ncbi:hypothetical protein P3S67_008410 [Capsicum chacoense]
MFMSSHHNSEKDWWYDIFVGQADFLPDDVGERIRKQRRVIVGDRTIEAGGGEAATSFFLPRSIDFLEIRYCRGLSSCFVDNFLSRTTSLRGLTCSTCGCDEIEWIVNVPSDRDTTTEPHCKSFHSLKVEWLPNLVGLCNGKIASHAFSGLTVLVICHCSRMKKLFPRAILQDLNNPISTPSSNLTLHIFEVHWLSNNQFFSP